MAIDSRKARTAVLGYGSSVPRLLPPPDSNVDEFDRAALLALYWLAVTAPSPATCHTLPADIRARILGPDR